MKVRRDTLTKMRFGIQLKLLAVALVPMGILLLSAVFVFHAIDSVADVVRKDSQLNRPLILTVESISQGFYRWDDDLNMAVMAVQDHHSQMVEPQVVDALAAQKNIYIQLHQVQTLGLAPRDALRLTQEIDRYASYSNAVIAALHADKPLRAVQIQLINNANISNVLVQDLMNIRQHYNAQYRVVTQSFTQFVGGLPETLLLTAVIALLLSVLAALFLATGMVRQIRRLIENLRRVEQGERTLIGTERIPNDEIGDALKALIHTIDTLNRTEKQLQEQLSFRQSLLQAIPVPVFVKDLEGRFIAINRAFKEFHGETAENIYGKTVFDVAPPELAGEHRDIDLTLMQQEKGATIYESQGMDAFGNLRDVMFHKAAFTQVDGEVDGLIGVMIDISERKSAERQILYLNQLYAVLAQTNQAIVRCQDEATLLQDVSRIAVEYGGMKLGWLGRYDQENGVIVPFSSYGDIDLLNDWMAFVLDQPTIRSPEEMAFHNNYIVIIQDYSADERTKLWCEGNQRHGIGSAASIPVQRDGKPYAVLSVYHVEKDFFNRTMVELLLEMAMDMGYALNRFDLETKRSAAEEQLRLFAQVFKQSHEGIVITDAQGDFLAVNQAFTNITGYSEEEVLGRVSGRQPKGFYRKMMSESTHDGYVQGEIWSRRKDGSEYPEWISISRVMSEEGNTTNYVSTITDITERKTAEKQIQRLAHYDPLTGLPNRTLLTARVGQAIHKAQDCGESLALMFVDLDHFKNINDTLGHRIGDLLLVELADRLQSFIREQDTVSRLGGDEFILLFPGMDSDSATDFAEQLMHFIAIPYRIEEHELTVTPSIGITVYPIDGNNWESLYRRADIAMYQAKQGGRNMFRFFVPEMQQNSERRLQLENALRRALEKEELTLYYQPQASLQSGRVVGVEALLRWRHPELGMIPPSEFITIAEESGMILPIGEWVLRTATMQMKEWLTMGLPSMTMAVNISATQLHQHNLPQLIKSILDDVFLPAEYLELELTESVAMKEPEVAIAMMSDLYEYGVRMSIDDFGTGYSSLAYLNRFRIDKLKIDQSFVKDIDSDPEDEAIVDAVISMARSLHVCTIAEGVETERELRWLRDHGCDEVQGYYLSKPLPANELWTWIQGKL